MNWNELKSTWAVQPSPALENSGLGPMQKFERSSRKLARTLFRRDWIEAAAGVVLVVHYARQWWRFGPAYWPYGLAILIIVGITVFFIRERIRTRGLRLGPDTPLLAKLDADLEELRHQRGLLRNVAIWYLAPLTLAATITQGTRVLNQPEILHGRSLAHFWLVHVLVFAIAGWGVWRLNRRAVRKKIEPLIIELEQLRANLLSPK